MKHIQNKKILKRIVLAVLVISIVIAILIKPSFVNKESKTQIPVDLKVKIGKLSNGLTYYIRHNELPSKRADFFIVQKVGSILEDETQRGLAHFLEHMCFNGTKNFPGNSLVRELEKRGIKFGENVNAVTAMDETIYNLSNIPVLNDGIIDTALLVLHDWSGFVSLNDKDIDDERGVISEEWRTNNIGDSRVLEKTYMNVFPGSRYAERMPIGLIDVIKTFPYQRIRDFYKKWYRPDLQAIIVVGDIEVDDIEAKIKKLFADIPAPVNPAKREEFIVPDNKEPIVSIVSDPETQTSGISVLFKKSPVPSSMKIWTDFYSDRIRTNLIGMMFTQRMYEIKHKPDAPFSSVSGGVSTFFNARTMDSWSIGVTPIDNKQTEKALRILLSENERMRRYGFTKAELERAKSDIIRSAESVYNERDRKPNSGYVKSYIAHFLKNEPIPGIGWEFDYIKNILPHITLKSINQKAKELVSDTNVVFVITGPQKENMPLPDKECVLNMWNDIIKSDIQPNLEEWKEKQIINEKPVGGKIVKTDQKSFGYKQWTLSNGVKVMFKNTDYKKDQVIITAYSPGGFSLIGDTDLPSALAINDLVPLGGIGELSEVDLSRALTGKTVQISPFVNSLSEGITGMASPDDFETFLQLTYLFFTKPKMDIELFNNWKNKVAVDLENKKLDPMNDLQDTLNKIITMNNPRGMIFNSDMLDKVDYRKAIKLYKERFADAEDFTFYITGNIKENNVKKMVERYLGGLPSTGRHEKIKDNGVYPPKGVIKKHFKKKMLTPKSTVYIVYTGKVQATLQNGILMDYIKSILNILYTESIREKEGGTYGVSVRGAINKIPDERFNFQIQFDTDSAKKSKLIEIAYNEINNLLSKSPSNENVNKVKEFLLKKHQEQLINNGYWSHMILALESNGVDFHTNYDKIVSDVTPTMIQDFARKIFSQKNIIEVCMDPK
ncbi:MAG: insulinase family protein [Rikenellaceae bacterium]|nr:insulinase family protein [Rikenellaceae bacterium]